MVNMRVREYIKNWLKYKELVTYYSEGDRFYFEKCVLLLTDEQPLNDLSYANWSKEVEEIYKDEWEKDASEIDYFLRFKDVLMSHILWDVSKGEFPNDELRNKPKVVSLIWEILEQHFLVLDDLPLVYILAIVEDPDYEGPNYLVDFGYNEELNLTIDDDSIILVEGCFQQLDMLPDCIQGVMKGEYEKLYDLIECTFGMLGGFKLLKKGPPKGWQQMKAAKIKDEPNQKTKEYAIKLYEEGTWKSTRQASIKLIEPVMCYGEEVKRRFTDNYTAQKCIYDWLLKHVNSK